MTTTKPNQKPLDKKAQQEGKGKLDIEIVQYTMKLSSLSKQRADVTKHLQKVVKTRKELFGDSDLPDIDMEAIAEEAEADKETE
jgi:hypothetical protein